LLDKSIVRVYYINNHDIDAKFHINGAGALLKSMAFKKQKFNTSKRIFYKLTILSLVFLFAFQPVAPVFAKPETSAKASVSIKINDKADKTKPQLDKAPDINAELPAINIEVQPKDENKNFDKEQSQDIEDRAEIKKDKEKTKGGGQSQEDSLSTEPAESALISDDVQQPSNYLTKQNLPEIDKNTNGQVEAKNVVIIKTTWSPINKDYIRVKTVGSGGLLVYKNGTVVTGTWEKKTDKDKLYFYDQNHKEIPFVPGSIWIEIDAH